MKLTQRQVNDLLTLIEHARTDIAYKEGGTYVDLDDDDKADEKAIRASERAIEFIKKLIVTP